MRKGIMVILIVTAFVAAMSGNVWAYFLDAPHNEANLIACATCHNVTHTPDPSDPDDTWANYLCQSCHDNVTAPQMSNHTDQVVNNKPTGQGLWTNQCIDCHDPHFQGQLDWIRTDTTDLWLVQGFIPFQTNYLYEPGVGGIFGQTTITFAAGAKANNPLFSDPVTWAAKGGFVDPSSAVDHNRGLLLVPGLADTSQVFEIVAANGSLAVGGTITVKGQVPSTQVGPFSQFGIIYGQSLKSYSLDANGFGNKNVKFFAPRLDTNETGYGDPSASTNPTGICQVCHPASIGHWNTDDSGDRHNAEGICTTCHPHGEGFRPTAHAFNFFVDVDSCGSCHSLLLAAPDAGHSSCETCHLPNSIPAINTNFTLTAEGISPSDALLTAGYFFGGTNGRLQDSAGNAIGDPGFQAISCGTCHTINGNSFFDHSSNTHSDGIDDTNDAPCEICHVAVVSPFVFAAGVQDPPGVTIPEPGEVHSKAPLCFHCHDSNTGVLIGSAMNHVIGTSSTCKTCHVDRANGHFPEHTNTAYEDTPSTETNQAITGQCEPCHAEQFNIATGHVGITVVTGELGTTPGTVVNCQTCHDNTTPAVVNTIATAKGTTPANVPASCADCHGPRPTPHAISAVDDNYFIDKDSTGNVLPVLDNDTGNGIILDSVGAATHGTTSINGGNILYTPTVGYVGNDNFQYTIKDSYAQTISATVNISIPVTVSLPTAISDIATVQQDSQNNIIDVLANDSDSDNDPLTVIQITTPAANGTCTANTTNVLYTPNPGFTGNDSCTYKITDGNGGYASAPISINVTNHHQTANSVIYDPVNDLSAGISCGTANCHAGEVEDWPAILTRHGNYTANGPSPCDTCHNASRDTSASGNLSIGQTVAQVITAGGPVRCLDCHLDAGGAGPSHP